MTLVGAPRVPHLRVEPDMEQRPTVHDTRRAALAGLMAGTPVAVVVTGALAAVAPEVAVLLLVVAAVGVAVWFRPVVAAVLTVTITPLVAGIDRGRIFPVFRPNEALVAFLAGVLILRWLVATLPGHRFVVRPNRIEVALMAMATANSVLPLLVMALRGQRIEADDISYALVLWKYLGVYALVRATVRTDRHIRICLWTALFSAAIVGLIGVLQALDLLGVRAALVGYYAPFGYTGALAAPRGGSTLALPAATADLLILNLVAACGLWWKDRRHGAVLLVLAAICVAGTFGAAEFSSALGLLIAVLCMTWAARRLHLLRWAPVAVVGGAAALWPVIEHRIAGFQNVSGLPVSWTTRWFNLKTYFWPELFTGSNPLLGVRPAARVVAANQGTGFVWIESGYTWLLWGGGLPLFAAFFFFVWVSLRTLWPQVRVLDSYASVAALAAFVGICVMTVLMIFDPHLTYRGAADWLFALLAMTSAAKRARGNEPPVRSAPTRRVP